ncbi:SpoIIE family protein phosphatase [Desulfocurvus sp. DL9XJH121]
MRFSLYKKILVLFGGTLVLVAVAVLTFSGRNVERTVFDAELRGAENIMRLVNVNLYGQFKSYLSWKVDMVSSRKRLLREESAILLSGIDHLSSGRSPREARALVLDWIGRAVDSPDKLVFVYDRGGRLLAVSGAGGNGNFLGVLHDFKGREVAPAMHQEAKRYGGGFSTFSLPGPDGRTLRYLGRFSLVPRWDWVLAVCDNLEGMVAEVARRQEGILQGLRETMPSITVADSGPVFLFDGQGTMLVPPERGLRDMLGLPGADQGELLRTMMTAATRKTDNPDQGPAVADFGEESKAAVFVAHFKPLDWYVAAAAPKAELRAPAVKLMGHLSWVMAVALGLGLLLAVALTRRIVRPLASLTGHVKDLPERDWTGEAEDLSELEVLARSHRDEVGALAEAFLYMDGALRKSIIDLMATEAEKSRIESELGVAREIQMGLLPKIFPPFPERDEVDLYAVLEPAREVGGDLYDFFFVDQDTLCIVVGDVSDKGVPAALFMTIAKTLVKNEALAGRPPEEILLRANDDLSRDNPNAMFVTIFVGLLDVRTGHLAFASGGHNPPLVLPAEGEPEFLREISGPMVGAMPGMSFVGREARLAPGDMLLVYTDGITEAMDVSKTMLTEDGLLAVARELRHAPAKDAVQGVVRATHEHAGEAPQSDDITLLAVRLRAAEGASGTGGA